MAKAKSKAKKPVPKAKAPVAKKKPAAKKAKPVAKKKPAIKKSKPVANKQPAATKTKPIAKAKHVAKTKPSAAAPPAPAPTASDWRGALRTAVEATGPDFAAYLRGLAAKGWEHADTAELAGLEAWGTELAKRDRMAGIGALVRAAQHGFPKVLEAGGIGLDGMNFKGSEASMDGAPVETQIALAAAWLDAPDRTHTAAVAAGNDPSRQLQVWDDDLRPSDDSAHWWYSDVGQCCGHAITRTKGDPAKDSYYDWPPETCVGRGLVVALRGLRGMGADLGAVLRDIRGALVA
jgi:hypothetical protein